MLALAAEPRLAALQAALVGWARRLTGASQAALVAVQGGDAVVDPAGAGPDLAGLPVQQAARAPGTVLVGRDRHGQQALLVGVEGSAWVLVLWGAEAAGSLETARLHQALRRKERARRAGGQAHRCPGGGAAAHRPRAPRRGWAGPGGCGDGPGGAGALARHHRGGRAEAAGSLYGPAGPGVDRGSSAAGAGRPGAGGRAGVADPGASPQPAG